jgi:hypothetical protein
MDPTVPPVIVSRDAPLNMDHPCIRCGYSLRGLNSSGVCPECGTPVERSLRGDLLAYSDPLYVQKLFNGTRTIMASLLLLIVCVVAVAFSATAGVGPLAVLAGLGMLASTIAFLVGWWMLTTPDAGQLSTNKGERPRQIVRSTLLVIVATALLSFVIRAIPAPGTQVLGGLLTLLNYVAMAVGFYAGMLYVRWLAPRIPNPKAWRRAKVLMILLAVMIGMYILLIIAVLLTVAGSGRSPVVGVLAGVVGIIALVGGLTALIMYYNLFSWMRKDLKNVLAVQATQGAPTP